MKVFFSLIKKEAFENIRTKKLLAMTVLFLLIGLISLLTAKLMPLILEPFLANLAENTLIRIKNPTGIDSWMQFFKNINQLGMFGLVLLYGNQVANEFQKGTLINLLSKGLARFQVVLSKWAFGILMWTLAYSLCFTLAFIYTGYFFENTFPLKNVLMAALLPYIFGVFLISVEILGGIICGNVIGTLIFVAGNIIIQYILSLKNEITRFLPIFLISKPINLIKNIEADTCLLSIFISFGLIIISIILSISILNKKQIS